eukprot:augustus_masked-scaffold_31-processed-gene-2.52-mRNA-1 protein AED:1.00 eAED:1.00 QI:0/0/0/0/1/1/2/0/384
MITVIHHYVSNMGGIFSKKKGKKKEKPELSSQDEAILKLKVARDKLSKAKIKYSYEEGLFKLKAKKFLAENKTGLAKLALKTKMLKSREIIKAEGKIFKLEEMINNIDMKSLEKDMFTSLQTGLDLMQKLNELLPADKIEDIMLESQEEVEKLEEVQSILSQPLESGEEQNIEKEYQSILQSMKATEPAIQSSQNLDPSAGQVAQLPSAPSHAPIELPSVPTAGKRTFDMLDSSPFPQAPTIQARTKNRRKVRSDIWLYMSRNNKGTGVHCKLCSNVYKLSTGTGTLWSHLKEKHNIFKSAGSVIAETSRRVDERQIKSTAKRERLQELDTLSRLISLQNVFDHEESEIIKSRLKVLVRQMGKEHEREKPPIEEDVQTYEYGQV